MDPKLKPLHREVTFWVLAFISTPGIIALYAGAVRVVLGGGEPDTEALLTGILASPLALYLGIGRQYARGMAARGYGQQIAAEATAQGALELHDWDEFVDAEAAAPLLSVAAVEQVDAEGER